MDKKLVKQIAREIRKEVNAIEQQPKNYVFNKEHASHRSKIVIVGPAGHRSRLSLLLREGMTKVKRTKVFDQPYDLGNMKDIPIELCTYEQLANSLYGKGRVGVVANDAFETIQNGIHLITGKKMQEHFKINKSTALKVVKTLNDLSRHRQPRLMQLLKFPEPDKKFSMSLRDLSPYEKNKDHVWLIADLKAYLSAELSEERFQEIGITFSSLDGLINTITDNVEKILVGTHQRNYAVAVSGYATLTVAVREFEFEHKSKDVPLDEELFIYLHVLEFAHFAVGYRKMVDVAIPQCLIAPVFRELQGLIENAFPKNSSGEVIEDEQLISLKEVPEFALSWQDEFIAIMEKSMGVNVTEVEYNQVRLGAQNLLRNFYWFRGDIKDVLRERAKQTFTMYEGEKIVSPWHIAAALCSVWHTLKSSTNFKPYWLGQLSQGGSINFGLNLSLLEMEFNINAIDRIPEEHRHIWSYRLEWFIDALHGHAELRTQKFAFRSALLKKVLEICRTNDTESIANTLIHFLEHIKSRALQHPGAG